MSDDHAQEVQQCIDDLKSKDVHVLSKALGRLEELKDLQALEPLLALLDDEERMSILYDPEYWENHVVVSTITSFGPPAVPTLIRHLEQRGTLVHILARIQTDESAEALLRFARKSARILDMLNYAWTSWLPDNVSSWNPFAQRMLNGNIEMVYDESFEFWENAAECIVWDLTNERFEEVLAHTPVTRRDKLRQLYEDVLSKRRDAASRRVK